MTQFRLKSANAQPLWVTLLFSIFVVIILTLSFIFFLPVFLAAFIVLGLVALGISWRIRKRMNELRKRFEQSKMDSSEKAEYVDFEDITDDRSHKK
ncbi:hypothetical protein JXA70_04170 [candidate division KSB1 bacterium]|nr:hypothetical protein [candidate division KSB1 bacterium]